LAASKTKDFSLSYLYNSACAYLVYVKLEAHLVPLVSNDKAVIIHQHLL